MVTKKDVLKALESCLDPEIGVSVIDMGLIYDVNVKAGTVHVKMTLTNPGCPMARMIVNDVENTIKKMKGIKEATVELVFEPKWTPDRLSDRAKKLLGYKG